MPKQDSNHYPITPKDYQKILQGVEFLYVSLIKLKYSCKSISDESIKIELKTNYSIKCQKNENVTISANFLLKGKTNDKVVISIEGEYLLEFLSKKTFTEEFFEVYKDMSLRILLWPYLRELFSNITQRSNMAPFILPLIKFIPTDE